MPGLRAISYGVPVTSRRLPDLGPSKAPSKAPIASATGLWRSPLRPDVTGWPARAALGAGAFSALLGPAALPPLDWSPCALVAWTPLVLVTFTGAWRQVLWAGAVHGGLLALMGAWWVAPALVRVGGLSLPAAAGLFAVFMLLEAARSVALAGVTWLGSRTGPGRWVAFPAALVVVDWIWPSVLPWTAALLVNAFPVWLQQAEIGGALAVSGWLGAVNGAVALAVHRWPDRRRFVPPAVVALALVTAAFAWGVSRMAEVDRAMAAAPPIRLALVQGRFAPAHLERRDQVAELRGATLSLLAKRRDVDLVVWPENAVVFPTDEQRLTALFRDHLTRDRSRGLDAPRIEVPLLTALVLARDGRLFDAAVIAQPGGRGLGVYAKRDLIPIGERALGPLAPERPFASGSDVTGMAFAGRRMSLSICFEDLLRERFREAVRSGQPDLLMNLTSDSWFGDSPAAAFHQALARLRAVEHRRFLVRATNDGPSAVIDPGGRIAAALAPRRPAAGVVEARWLSGTTAYGRVGDGPVVGAALALLVLAAAIGFRKTRGLA